MKRCVFGLKMLWLSCVTQVHAGEVMMLPEVRTAVDALSEGRVSQALQSFEQLADQGLEDPVLSYNRGLAYAYLYAHSSTNPAEQGSMLGQAAHGLVEASRQTRDASLRKLATQGLAVVREDGVRLAARTGLPTDLKRGDPIFRIWIAALPWSVCTRTAGILGVLVALPCVLGFWSRRSRMYLRVQRMARGGFPMFVMAVGMAVAIKVESIFPMSSGIVVVSDAHLMQEPGRTQHPQTTAVVPGTAWVHIRESRGDWLRVQWGNATGWVSARTVRRLSEGRALR